MARHQEFEEKTIINKAMQLFWARGYHLSSSHDIVETTGLSRSSIYNTFGDKRGLFIASLKHYVACESNALLETLHKTPPNSDGLRSLLWHVVDAALRADGPGGCLVVNTASEMGTSDAEIHGLLMDNVHGVIAAFERFIGEGQSAGTFPKVHDAASMAVLLFQQMTAIRLSSKVIKERSHYAAGIDVLLHVFSH